MKTLLFCVMMALLSVGCKPKDSAISQSHQQQFAGKKIYFLDSYHESYEPNMKVRSAFEKGIAEKGILVSYGYLDEKNMSDTALLAKKAAELFEQIKKFKPDLIVVSDDPAMKYVVQPYLETGVPVVFVGVNWSYENKSPSITGQLEVELLDRLIADLKGVSEGSRIGILTAKTTTDEKSIRAYKEVLGISFEKEVLVETFSQWKSAYKELQSQVDIVIVRQNAGIAAWDAIEASRFVIAESTIPSGSPNLHMADLVLLCYPKLNEEYGEYAAKTALEILGGKAPKDVPIAKNVRTNVTINTVLTKKLEVTFPAALLEDAHFVPSEKKKIAFVNSYHSGYEWSDAIELSFLKTLGIATPSGKESYVSGGNEIRIYRMDAKNNPTEPFQTRRAMEIHKDLDLWKPDVIVAADDDASKWLIVPYYKNSMVPVLFCGLNWDASVYGFPTKNVTGMVEVAPVVELLAFLKKLGTGQRVAYLGANVLSEQKEIDHYTKRLNLQFSDGKLVNTTEEWKNAFLHYQKTADILLLVSHVGIAGWDDREMKAFVENHSTIPSGTTARAVRPYSLLTFARVAEEQGWWAGEQVKAVLSGTAIETIGTTTNQRSAKYANPILMKKNTIRIPAEMVDSVSLE